MASTREIRKEKRVLNLVGYEGSIQTRNGWMGQDVCIRKRTKEEEI